MLRGHEEAEKGKSLYQEIVNKVYAFEEFYREQKLIYVIYLNPRAFAQLFRYLLVLDTSLAGYPYMLKEDLVTPYEIKWIE